MPSVLPDADCRYRSKQASECSAAVFASVSPGRGCQPPAIDTLFIVEIDRVPERRRAGHVASRIALGRALLAARPAPVETHRRPELHHGPSGRPELRGVGNGGSRSMACCSLAHAGPAGLAVVAPWPVGADLEPARRFSAAFADGIARASEQELVRNSGVAPAEAPAAIWTAKEATLKALGEGLRIDPRNVRLTERIPGGWRLRISTEGARSRTVARSRDAEWDVESSTISGWRLAVARPSGADPIRLLVVSWPKTAIDMPRPS